MSGYHVYKNIIFSIGANVSKFNRKVIFTYDKTEHYSCIIMFLNSLRLHGLIRHVIKMTVSIIKFMNVYVLRNLADQWS